MPSTVTPPPIIVKDSLAVPKTSYLPTRTDMAKRHREDGRRRHTGAVQSSRESLEARFESAGGAQVCGAHAVAREDVFAAGRSISRRRSRRV
jgi:hypothetical protein